ncbi:hypothetical protein HY949_03105 [Candidatus Gottesmanbacteria bacterium]|nr:hypothetical protein [Candidatus Gottesmanbacteria bacterium]
MFKKLFYLSVLTALLLNACNALPGSTPPDPSVIATAKVEATETQAARNTQGAQNSYALTATAIIGALNPATTPMPNLTPGATAGSSTTTGGTCPTRREVNDMVFGKNPDGSSKDVVVQVSTESGAWQINTGKPENWFFVSLPLEKGLIATMHRPGNAKAEVFIADAKEYKAFRATFRFAGCYSPSDDMNAKDAANRILVKENVNGTYQFWMQNKRVQDWTFSVLAGNFYCPADVCPAIPPVATFVPAAPAASLTCPTFGGMATTLGNDGGSFCKYKGSVVTDSVPTGFKAEYWDGSAVKTAVAGEKISTGEATFRRP